MKTKIKIPMFLVPYENEKLMRLGNDFDGGYLVDEKTVHDSQYLISVGIGYDWSFEKHFFKLNKCNILSYDGSVGSKFFSAKIKHRIKSLFKEPKVNYFKKTIWWILLPLRFFYFFSNIGISSKIKHHELFVSNDHLHEKQENYISIDEIFNNLPIDAKVFLKIDIEGAEYALLESIIKVQRRLTSLAIEFHNLDDDRYLELESFIDSFELVLSHSHVNIAGKINDNNTASVIELTFVRDLVKGNKVEKFPHSLDMDSFPNNKDYEITF